MGQKVNFNEITKIIEITLAPDIDGDVLINVKGDLYSDGKEDWVTAENLRKFYFPISVEGGKPLPGEEELGSTFFLNSDWKIRPYNASHRLIINGNLYSVDGSDPFLDTIGTYTVRIMQKVSSLVSSTVAQLPEIAEMRKTIYNKKSLVKNGSIWELIIYDNDNITPILNKALKDKNGNNITDLVAGILAEELQSSV
jgi:hypothetical protein